MHANDTTPLTPYQWDIWTASSLHPDLPQYNTHVYERITGGVDTDLLRDCLARAVTENDALRLRFDEDADGKPYQWVDDEPVHVEFHDFLTAPDPRASCVSMMRSISDTPVPIRRGRMYHVAVLRESETVAYAYLNAHHLVADGWSLHLFLTQVRADLAHRVRTGTPLPTTPRSYLAQAEEAARYLGSAEHRGDIAHFAALLAGDPPALFTRRAASGSYPVARHRFELGRDLVDRIRDQGGSPFSFVSAALSVYLSRVHGTGEVVIGVPLFNRRTDDERATVGQFANALPMTVATPAGRTMRELVADVRASARELRAHERVPIGDLLRALPGSGPRQLFDVTVSSIRWPRPEPVDGLTHEVGVSGHPHERDVLAIVVDESDEHGPVVVDIDHATDVFDADLTIESLAGHLSALVRNALDDLDAPLSTIPMLADDEHEHLVTGVNATAAPYRDDRTLHALFEEQAARLPDRVALVADGTGGTLTFAELDARANQVAHALLADGVRPEDRVAVLMGRGTGLVTAVLGVLKAGAAYVPVDPGYPHERIAFMLADSGARVVLTDGGVPAGLDLAGVAVRELAGVSDLPVHPVGPTSGPRDLAYVIYTSGSTGRPKGVMVEHHSVVNRLAWMQKRYPLTGADRLLQKTPASFDVSVWELFWWAVEGASLTLPPPGAEKDPRELLRVVADNGVTVLHFVPSMLGPFLDLLEGSPELRGHAASLRTVFCSGEELPAARVDQFTRIFAGTTAPRLVNLYGPTEATVDVSYFDCPADPARPVGRVPIGHPIDNTTLYVVGRDDHLQPVGVPGELCIAGVGVARGYLDRPELTAEKFVDDPFVPGRRMYRTGDLARRLADGALEYLGRIDGQVKVRGNRIELGEVRAALAAHAGVREAVVVDRRTDARGTHLVGYYVADAPLEAADLRSHLAATLPEFMIPTFFVPIERVPLTPNGKLDRAALPAPVTAADAADDQAPRDRTEAALAEIWCGILDLPSVGVHQNWFTIGGDSILALRVRAAAEQRGLHFALADLVQNPTVAGLAARVSTTAPVRAAVAPFELVSGVDRARLAGVEDAYPATHLHLGLLYHSAEHEVSAVYHDVFRYVVKTEWDEQAFRDAFALLVARHPVLRSSFDLGTFSEPLQVVHHEVPSALEIADLRDLDPDAAQAHIDAHVEQRRFHHYRFDQAPLYVMRAHVLPGAVDLVFSFHHVILDGWSVASLVRELLQDYLHLSGAPIGPVPDTALPTPAAYAVEERRTVESAEAKNYWRDKLATAELTQLDGLRQYEPPGDESLNVRWIELPDGLGERVRRFAGEHELPVKSVLFAAHCLTLRLFSGQQDVVTGFVMHGRPEQADAERIAGLFLNTVPLRVGPGQDTWLEMVREVYRQEQECHPYRRYPLHSIQNDRGGDPVLEAVFNFVHMHVLTPVFDLPGIELLDFQTWEQTNFTLLVNAIVSPIDGHISLRVDTDGRTFSPDQTNLLIDSFFAILGRLVDDPHGELAFAFLADEQGTVLPAVEAPSDIVARLAAHVARTPEAIAVAHDGEEWTYEQFDQVSDRVARHLITLGAGRGVCVGIAMERSPEMVATIYGIAKSGAACVPLDVTYPEERITAMVERAEPLCIVAHDRHAHLVADPALRVSFESSMADATTAEPLPLPLIDPADLLYVLFTSGSTGTPKGVAMPHRALDNYQSWQVNARSGAPGGRTLQFAPLSFDVSFQEIYSTISGGGCLQMISEEQRRDMPALLRMLERERVERVFVPYVALQQLAEAADTLGIFPSHLRVVISSGEQLRVTAEIRRFMAGLTDAVLENQYGPTETHLVTAYTMSGDPDTFPNLPPIGPATNGVELYLLDESMRPVPKGVIGELYFGGIQLAHGYYGQPELTEQRFIPNPFGPRGSRLYRTGDLARVLPSGDLIWVARTDTQTKIRGYRVEPLEVEIAIMTLGQQYPGLREAAVVARRRDRVDSFLAAFLVGDKDSVDLDELRRQLRESLPDYMVPAHFTWLDAMPTTPSGKRNDAALRELPLTATSSAEHVAPRDRYEHALVEILGELLHLPSLGVHDNFFELGGTSLTAMRLVVVLEKRFGVGVPLSSFITTPTVAGLAKLLRSGNADLAFDPLVPIRPTGSRPPIFLVHPLGGNVLCYARLARHLPPDQPVYALQAAGGDAGTEAVRSVTELAAGYLEAVRRVQPDGPYTIGGWSFGGMVAFEMAHQLRGNGGVGHLLLIDPIARQSWEYEQVPDDSLLEWFFWELIWLERSGRAPVEAIPRELATVEEKFDFITRRATEAGVLRAGSSAASVRRLFQVFEANWAALIDYRPEVGDDDITLLRASERLPQVLVPMHTAAGTLHVDSTNGWGRLTTGRVEVIDVPGDHLVLMEEPYVAEVARQITHVLSGRYGDRSDGKEAA
jgi:amino acid adenylation domain-containing protein